MPSFDEVVTQEFSSSLEALFLVSVLPRYREAYLQLDDVGDNRYNLKAEFSRVLSNVMEREDFLVAVGRIVSGGKLYGSESLAQQGRCGYCGRKLNDKLQCIKCGIEWQSREGDPIEWKPIKRGDRERLLHAVVEVSMTKPVYLKHEIGGGGE